MVEVCNQAVKTVRAVLQALPSTHVALVVSWVIKSSLMAWVYGCLLMCQKSRLLRLSTIVFVEQNLAPLNPVHIAKAILASMFFRRIDGVCACWMR